MNRKTYRLRKFSREFILEVLNNPPHGYYKQAPRQTEEIAVLEVMTDFRCDAYITRYPKEIMCFSRDGIDLWIPFELIEEIKAPDEQAI